MPLTGQKTPLDPHQEPQEKETRMQPETPLQPSDDTSENPCPAPAAQGAPLRERLRAWHAQMQCRLVRFSHKLKKKTRARRRASMRRFHALPLYHWLGESLYELGFQGEYFAVRTARASRRGAAAAAVLLRRAGRYAGAFFGAIGVTFWEDLLRPVVVFFRGIFHVFRTAHRVRKEKGFARAVWAALCYLGRGIRLYARLLPRTVTYILPVAAAIVCGMYIRQQLAVGYTLGVQVNGATVGYVENEGVFETARLDVDERINYAGTSETSWNITPTYTLTRRDASGAVLSENEMADAILEASSNEIAEGTALYIDGALCKVTRDGAELNAYLNGLKAPYTEQADADTVVQFNHDVQTVDGIFFTDSFSDYDDVVSYLSSDQTSEQDYTIVAGDSISLIASKNGLTTAQLYALNPGLSADSQLLPGDTLLVQKQEAVLEVQIIKTVTYTETIPFTSNTTESDDYSWGTTKTIQAGVDGIRSITAQITYDTAGNELANVILSQEVVQEPVTEEIVKGTKTAKGSVAKTATGSLMWPVPGYTYCSRWYSPGGHKGVDICASYGTPILAADSGRVVAAGFSAAGNGYGYSIVIDHGNGYKTLYGHCSALNVSTGDYVSRGQVIGLVGSTGRSTGNHCHFEIFYNGSRIPPQSIFGGGSRPV
jgi:murein DD-endopeptidase MepM/ murein hydrolase activator NlpD